LNIPIPIRSAPAPAWSTVTRFSRPGHERRKENREGAEFGRVSDWFRPMGNVIKIVDELEGKKTDRQRRRGRQPALRQMVGAYPPLRVKAADQPEGEKMAVFVEEQRQHGQGERHPQPPSSAPQCRPVGD